MNAPFTIRKVTLELDGKKVESELDLKVLPDKTYEIHVGPDDQIKAIEKTPGPVTLRLDPDDPALTRWTTVVVKRVGYLASDSATLYQGPFFGDVVPEAPSRTASVDCMPLCWLRPGMECEVLSAKTWLNLIGTRRSNDGSAPGPVGVVFQVVSGLTPLGLFFWNPHAGRLDDQRQSGWNGSLMVERFSDFRGPDLSSGSQESRKLEDVELNRSVYRPIRAAVR